jgi:hypothetical protein
MPKLPPLKSFRVPADKDTQNATTSPAEIWGGDFTARHAVVRRLLAQCLPQVLFSPPICLSVLLPFSRQSLKALAVYYLDY